MPCATAAPHSGDGFEAFDYRQYIRSFIHIKDEGIRQEVDRDLDSDKLWPEPLIQFNPACQKAGTAEALRGHMGLTAVR